MHNNTFDEMGFPNHTKKDPFWKKIRFLTLLR